MIMIALRFGRKFELKKLFFFNVFLGFDRRLFSQGRNEVRQDNVNGFPIIK
jgi:hypothetical protein